MATAARLAIGTLLKLGDGGSPETFTTIPEVKEVRLPSLKLEFVDVTNMDSASSFREFIAGLKSGDEITYSCNRVNTSAQNAVYTAHNAGTTKNFQIVFPTSPTETYSFAAIITGWDVYGAPDGALMADFTIKLTGVVTRS